MKVKLKDIALLALLAALMVVGDGGLEWLPNIHLVGVLIVVATAVYRVYALLPIYVYVFITGFIGGFALWWIPYIYIWLPLWAAVMLIPKKLSLKIKVPLYVTAATLHGFLFGTLYAPAQALMFGLDFKGMIAWIIAGLYFDLIHGLSNLVLGTLLIYPFIKILKHTDKYAR
ncbi:MAG: hypothetical protein Q4B40_04850 [Clostridia bacterium]|nr:hypothetical protein [Clostridia bacterium]